MATKHALSRLPVHRFCSRAPVPAKRISWREVSARSEAFFSHKPAVTISSRSLSTFDRNSIQGEFGAYAKQYDESITSPEGFWKEAANDLHWFEEPQTTLQQSETNPHLHDWFPDGKINTSYNCLDVNVQNGRGDQTALIYDSPVTNTKESYTYNELLEQVSAFAGVLQNDLGVQTGDRVVIYMPLIPQAAIAMLACSRIGTFSSQQVKSAFIHSTCSNANLFLVHRSCTFRCLRRLC